MIDRVVQSNTEIVNFTGQPAGLYFVTVQEGDQIKGHYKLILQ